MNMLGRAPTSSELAAGIMAQPFTLFTRLFTSSEFLSKGLYVTMLYYLILERAPNPSDLALWLNAGGNGQSAGLIGSAEFLARFQ
jgi:hypothetical protein